MASRRKVNLFIEVDEDIFVNVVEPLKKSKTFSKLMAALLTGYLRDNYIRSYGDGTLEELHKASVESLDSVLNSMNESLSNLGLYTDDLSEANKRGQQVFEEARESASQRVQSAKDEDVAALKQEISSVREQTSEIWGLLQQLVQGNMTIGTYQNNSSIPVSEEMEEVEIPTGDLEEEANVNDMFGLIGNNIGIY